MAGRFTVEAVFKAIDKVTAPVKRIQNRMGKFTRSARRGLRSLNNGLNKFIRGMRKAAVVGAAGLFIIGTAMAGVIKTGAEFEQQIVNATAKIDGLARGSAEFAAAQKILEDQARRLGATTEFTAAQAAQALNELTTAGFNASQAAAALPGILDLATIGEMDLAEAADIATGALGSFNLKVKDSVQLATNLTRVNDVLAKVATTSKAKIADLAETLKYAGSLANAAGQSIETFGALTGIMAEGSVRGSLAGTALKSLFTRLASPSAKAQAIFKKLGVTIRDSSGNFRDMADIIGDLGPKINELGTAEKTAAIREIFGRQGIAGGTLILQAGGEALRRYRQRLIDANGASKDMAAIMRDTLLGRLKALKSAIESVVLTIFGATKGPVADMIESMTEWIRLNEKFIGQKVNEYVKKIVDNWPLIVKTAKAIGITVIVVTSLVAILKIFVLVMTAVNLVLAANPIVLIVLAVIALIAIIAVAIFAVIKFRKRIIEWYKSLGMTGKVIVALVTGPIGMLIAAASLIIDNWKPIKDFFDKLSESLSETANKFGGLKDAMSGGLFGGLLGGNTAIGSRKDLSASKLFGKSGNDDDDEKPSPNTQIVSHGEAVGKFAARVMSGELDINVSAADGSEATITRKKASDGLKLIMSGAFE